MTSEKLTTKKVLLIVTLILMAYAFIYIGANVSWLAFLPTVGVAILVGIIYWEKREHEKKSGMRCKPELDYFGGVSPPSPTRRAEREQT